MSHLHCKSLRDRKGKSLCDRKAQQGSALLVALVLIFMMSIMGASAMRESTLEHKMASNSAQARDVFQAAESSNEIALNDLDNLKKVLTDCVMTLTTSVRDDVGMRSAVTLRYIGEGNAAGFSLDASQNSSSISAKRYVAEGVAIVDAVRARRTIEQGATRPSPSINIRSGSPC